MKRDFATVIFAQNAQEGFGVGDQAAHHAALGLAQRCDAPTILALTDLMAFLDRVGGQAHITTLRRRDEDELSYTTEALAIGYETRDAKVVVAQGPQMIPIEGADGVPVEVPVEEFDQPPTRVEIERPAAPDVEDDVRDEIEHEADALATEEPEPVASG